MNRIRKGMTATALALVVAAASMTLAQQRSADTALRAATETEAVRGMSAAIEQYKRVADTYRRSDPATAAQALLRMAVAYEKLGNAEARKIYERVIKEFGGQKEAVAVANERLGAMASRRIWGTDPKSGWSLSTVSADGRFVSYIDWVTGHFGVHEFATGLDRRLTKSGIPNWVEDAAISRDNRYVAYNMFNSITYRYELHVVSIDGASNQLLFRADDVEWVMPFDWSPDGNWIAVQLMRTNRVGQMGLISAKDGSLRLLRSTEWLGASRLFFSPDGKYVGYDLPVLNDPQQRDVFVLAVAGDRQTAAATGPNNEWMMGWSLDGKHLLFSSDRSGTTGLWAIALTDGQPRGEPHIVKTDIGRYSLGVSASGSLYSTVSVGDRDVRIASIDPSTGKLVSGPVRPISKFVGTNSGPAWSPDGKRLAYRSARTGLGSAYIASDVLGILSLETGVSHELRPKLGYFQTVQWLLNGDLVVNGRDLTDNRRNFRVDPDTGAISPSGPTQIFPDGSRVYRRADRGAEGSAVIERTVATGADREIFRHKDLQSFFLSPDGRSIAVTTSRSAADKPWTLTLLVANVDGGTPRELIRVQQPATRSRAIATWVGSRALAVSSMVGEKGNQEELLLVPVDGSRPRKLDVGTEGYGNDIVFSPDGTHVAYTSGSRGTEVWVLDNFLASLKASK